MNGWQWEGYVEGSGARSLPSRPFHAFFPRSARLPCSGDHFALTNATTAAFCSRNGYCTLFAGVACVCIAMTCPFLFCFETCILGPAAGCRQGFMRALYALYHIPWLQRVRKSEDEPCGLALRHFLIVAASSLCYGFLRLASEGNPDGSLQVVCSMIMLHRYHVHTGASDQ